MVQIVSNPNEGRTTARREAFDRAFQQAVAGTGGMYKSIKEGEERTARQQAFEREKQRQDMADRLKLSKESGIDISQQDLERIRAGEEDQPAEGMGLRRPGFSDISAGIRAKDEAARKQAQIDKDLERRYKEAQIGSLGAKSTAEKEYKPSQYVAGGFAKRAEQAITDLDKLPKNIGSETWQGTFMGSSLFPEALKSGDWKAYENTKRNFVSAVLRRESGAAIPPEEQKQEEIKYFPQPGDTDTVLRQKERLRRQAIANLKAEAGGAYGKIATAEMTKEEPSQEGAAMLNNAMDAAISPAMADGPLLMQRDPKKGQLLMQLREKAKRAGLR